MKIDNFDFAKLIEVVPQQYGEATQLYPDIKCGSHEWDNRTTIENAIWLIRHLTSRSGRAAETCGQFGHLHYWKDGICIYCGASKPPPT